MSVLHALGAPFGVRAAGDVLDLVESVLDVGLELIGRDMFAAKRVARINREHGVHLEVFAPLEELEQAHSVRRMIHPGARMGGTIDERADGFLPLETVCDSVALKIIAARKAQESWVHGGELFHQIDAIAVDAIVICGREKGDELQPQSSGMRDRENEVVGG